jgi:deazaflavin-dependent oxidoreductase (nitroreductase family)
VGEIHRPATAEFARQDLPRHQRPDRASHPARHPTQPATAHGGRENRYTAHQFTDIRSLTYANDRGNYLVVASKGGDPKAPGWYHNLKANPQIDINVGPKRFGVTAKPVLPDDPHYARLWQIVNKNDANRYEGYQKRTSRPTPVVVLTPA